MSTMTKALSLLATLTLLLLAAEQAHCSREGEIIGGWAETLGEELWQLGRRITMAPELKKIYNSLNIRVEEKNGKELLHSAVETIGRMLTRKMEAIQCIMREAEEMSLQYEYNETDANFTYYSAKYSVIDGVRLNELPKNRVNDSYMYRSFDLNADTHFFNISVNTSFSTVHVPTNVYDKGPEVSRTLLWSEYLDDVFVQNYKADPALSWQYFCSSTGVMRQYPGIAWKIGDKADLFDCRTRSWFIEAATCSKDVVILFDNSGSMSGYRNFVAKFTVERLLETLSNNDFVNILSFSNETTEAVPCFQDMLVQATPENIRTLNEAVADLEPDGYANFTNAYMQAFDLLENYRRIRECDKKGCNQIIMLVTDGVPGNLTNVFEVYNWLENGTNIPVRVFTYLIGKEVTNVREIQWMACLNRGYYVHIQSLDEVQENVLKYINVIARPMVLQEVDHPVTWTHIYTDITPSEKSSKGRNKYRLMTSAAIPIYDIKVNRNNESESRMANLLGVAGTDVPIEEIDRLTLPYKLGVNGYSFIVSNNGYLLLHPELRPVYKGNRKENYNSVDIVELEAIAESDKLRALGDNILYLREALVGEEEGYFLNQTVKIMYDKMRRIQLESQDYYFAPLPKTPFFLGIVLPHDYGNTWIKVGDEIRRNQHLGYKVENFFLGKNWRVHPKWVYCKYHYLEGHEFDTPEEELLHFLKKMGEPDWVWREQYELEPEKDLDGDMEPDLNCGRGTLGDDDYFCNKELVQLLVFDAKATDRLFTSWKFNDEEEEELFLKYNASIRFAATMSGLTRWQFVFDDTSELVSEFGENFTETIDETWYKSAIFQNQIEPDSFVFSVPFDNEISGDVLVTASHALFPRDGGNTAPVGVLGYQFSHELLYQRFMDISSGNYECKNSSCMNDGWQRYILDSSGYVILSEESNHTGSFFGEVDGPIMQAMIDADIFKKIIAYDLQGVCFRNVPKKNIGSILLTPFKYLMMAFQWIGAQLAWTMMQTQLSLLWDQYGVYSVHYDDEDDYVFDEDMDYMAGDKHDDFPTATQKPRRIMKGQDQEEEEYYNRVEKIVTEREAYPCDREANLYILQQEQFIKGDGFMAFEATKTTRPYFVKRIPHSNMLILVVNTLYAQSDENVQLKAGAHPIPHTGELPPPCYKLHLANLTRRPLEGCYTEHPYESEVTMCGRCSLANASIFVMVICWLVLKFKHILI